MINLKKTGDVKKLKHIIQAQNLFIPHCNIKNEENFKPLLLLRYKHIFYEN